MTPSQKRTRIRVERAGRNTIETVSEVSTAPAGGPAAWQVLVITQGDYRLGETYKLIRAIGLPCELTVQSVQPIESRDFKQVTFAVNHGSQRRLPV